MGSGRSIRREEGWPRMLVRSISGTCSQSSLKCGQSRCFAYTITLMVDEKKSDATTSNPVDEGVQAGHYDTSLRRLPFGRRIQIPIIAAAVTGLVRAVGPTLRIDVLGVDHVKKFFIGGQPCI